MNEKNGGFEKPEPNKNDAISNFTNVKNLERNKKRSQKKINSEQSQNYNNITTKFTTCELKFEAILEEIHYNFENLNLLVIDQYKLSKKDIRDLIYFLNNINSTSNNNSENSISLREEDTVIKPAIKPENTDNSISFSEEDISIKPVIKQENTDQVKYNENLNILDESQTMLKINEDENERYILSKDSNLNLNKKRKKSHEKKPGKKNKKKKNSKNN